VRDRNEPLRSDAQRNRERIIEVALEALTRSGDASLTSIAKQAGVGQGTFYRHFPNREALVLEVYRHEVEQVAEAACRLLETRPPDQALREWLDRLAQYAMTKAGLADAMRRACSHDSLMSVSRGPLTTAVSTLLAANEQAGTIRHGLDVEDVLLAIGGLWQIDPKGDWRQRAGRLLDVVMDGFRTGAPGRPADVVD
jgi:AcrR family transcriptional regulator